MAEREEDEDIVYFEDDDEDVGYLDVDSPEIIFVSYEKRKKDDQMYG